MRRQHEAIKLPRFGDRANRKELPMNDNIQTFKVGRTYSVRSICDYNCIFRFEVLKRSEKTITIKHHDREVRRTVRVVDGVECCDPHGRYSMSPVLRATD
jgi:hypothetical protein